MFHQTLTHEQTKRHTEKIFTVTMHKKWKQTHTVIFVNNNNTIGINPLCIHSFQRTHTYLLSLTSLHSPCLAALSWYQNPKSSVRHLNRDSYLAFHLFNFNSSSVFPCLPAWHCSPSALLSESCWSYEGLFESLLQWWLQPPLTCFTLIVVARW